MYAASSMIGYLRGKSYIQQVYVTTPMVVYLLGSYPVEYIHG